MIVGDVDAFAAKHPETYKDFMEWRLPNLDKTK